MRKQLLISMLGSVVVAPLGVWFGFLPAVLVGLLTIPFLGLAAFGVFSIEQSRHSKNSDVLTDLRPVMWVSIGVGFPLGMIIAYIVIIYFRLMPT